MKKRPTPQGADLFNDISVDDRNIIQEYLPGLSVVTAGTLAAGFLSDHYSIPLTLMALLVGLALNFLSTDRRLAPGLTFASKSLLRWGIVLVGTRITYGQILALGPEALVAVVIILALAIGFGILAARWLGVGKSFGLLAAGAVGICGASAAMALATTLGQRRINHAQLTLVLVGISAMSAAAMILYPLIAHFFEMSNLKAGFLLGASIHDVAQALGAGYSYSNEAGEIAAIVKLTRVALLAPVLLIVSLVLPRESTEKSEIDIPWFVIGFFVLAGINSMMPIPQVVTEITQDMAAAALAAAVTATAILSPLNKLLKSGFRPILLIFMITLVSLLLSLATAIFFIHK